MRALTAVVLCAWALFATPGRTMAQSVEGAARGLHYGLTGVVAKIQAGMLIIKVPHDLQPRAISPGKADRVGLHHAKIGEPVCCSWTPATSSRCGNGDSKGFVPASGAERTDGLF